MTQNQHTIEPIGVIHTPFKEKFAIPRQPRLVPQATGIIRLGGANNDETCVRGLEQFSHLWLLFLFHQNLEKGWTPAIRPPRLGGNKKVGVFASRATFRPNGIGMSAVALQEIRKSAHGVEVVVSGVDLLDQTPIVDIKPYIPYSDIIEHADGGFAEQPPASGMTVAFSVQASAQCRQLLPHYPDLDVLIENLLLQDPRPAYKQRSDKEQHYGVKLHDLEVRWTVNGQTTLVTEIKRL